MPLYEYRCESCGDVFEVMQKFADEPLTTHEGCGGKVERLLSAPALQFKGSGWYVTDYARKHSGNGSSRSDSGTADSKAEPKAPAKTEAKPDSSKSTSPSAK